MTESPTSQRTSKPGSSGLRGFFIALLLALLSFLAIEQQRPPAVVPADAPATEFSAARALEHLKVIAREPHPAGSPESARVREYILSRLRALGLDPVVQTTTVVRYNPKWGDRPAMAATVSNIVVPMFWHEPANAVMLAAHYDSVPSGPGASDDGSGVATLLETARALAAGPRLRNGILLLFTDGEELGMLGAKAFVEESPWAKDVAVALNFEARGACGPSVLFETSNQNGWVIREFARAAPHPVTSSLMFDAYKRLPYDTDLSVFKRAGMAGLNFAYVGCWPRYHTMRDDVQDLAARSLQQQGSYALALARHFGDLDLHRTTGPQAVYFSFFSKVFHYPQTWAIPLLTAALVLFVGVVGVGLRKRQLAWRGMAESFVAWGAGAFLAAGAAELLWWGLRAARGVSLLPYGVGYNSDVYAFGFLALTVAVVSAVYAWLGQKISVGSMTVGALAWWALVALAASLRAPGGSYLFTWPLLASLLELGYAFLSRQPEAEEESVLVWTLPAIIGIFLFVPILDDLVMWVSASHPAVLAVAMALLVGFLVPQFHILAARRRWLVPGTALSVAVVLIAVGLARSGYNPGHPRADSVFYALNADTGKAVWASADPAPDKWTAQFLTDHPRRGDLHGFFFRKANLLEADAPAASLAAPEVMRTDDVTLGDLRVLRLSITSPRQARSVWMQVGDAKVLEADVNGKKVDTPGAQSWGLIYAGLPKDGIVLTLHVPVSQTPTLKIFDMSDGLPSLPGQSFRARPSDTMPAPSRPDSVTWVGKTYRFEVNAPMEMHHH